MPLTPKQKDYNAARSEWHNLARRETRALVVTPTPGSIPPIDLDDPRSLLNLLPSEMQTAALKLPLELFDLHPTQLEQKAFAQGIQKTIYRKLRIAFWEEYEKCQKEGANKIDVDAAVRRTCSPSFMRSRVVSDPARLAWLLTPPNEYTISLKEISELGLERMKEALEVPISHESPNTKLIEAQLKIFQYADQRLKGAIVQRIEQRALNMNVNADASPEIVDKAEKVTKMSMQEIEAEILRLEGRSKAAEIPGTVHVDLMKHTRAVKLESTVEQPALQKKAKPDPV